MYDIRTSEIQERKFGFFDCMTSCLLGASLRWGGAKDGFGFDMAAPLGQLGELTVTMTS